MPVREREPRWGVPMKSDLAVRAGIDALLGCLAAWSPSYVPERERHTLALGGLLVLKRGMGIPRADLIPIYKACGCAVCLQEAAALEGKSDG